MKTNFITYILNKTNLLIARISIIIISMIISALSMQSAPRTQKTTNQKDDTFVVVIDAGHGGKDYGAIDNGVNEKDINLAVAKKLAEKIRKEMKNVNVVMTRDNDTFISLQERANIANRNKGNLFISIHTNSVDTKNPNRTSVSGTSVYALGPQKDANNLQVAQRENSVIELEDNFNQKYSGFDPQKDESYIIFEIAQKKTLGQSLKFADTAQNELVKTAGRKNRGVKQAGFWVLWATSMPSVLVELDFICNPDEAKFMASEEGQEKLAKSLLNAIKKYTNSLYADSKEKNKDNINLFEASSDKNVETPSGNVSDWTQEGNVNTLSSFNSKNSAKREHLQTDENTRNNNYYKPRKRRSDLSKKSYENKSFETFAIKTVNETDYLAQKDKVVEEKKPEQESKGTVDKNLKKDKRKDKKNNKNNSQQKKPNLNKSGQEVAKETKKTDIKVATKNGNNGKKKFAISSTSVGTSGLKEETRKDSQESKSLITANNTDKKDNTKRAEKTDNSNTKNTSSKENKVRSRSVETTNASKSDSGITVYTIVLLSSKKELAKDDPAFCNLVPTGMFEENGIYRYTYSSSVSRSEAERNLLNIKSIIPEATIVVRTQ